MVRFLLLRSGIGLALIVGLAGCAAPRVESAPRTYTTQVRMEGKWPFTTVVVNGEPLRFIVDTAAGGSVIDADVAKRLGLPAAG